MRKLVLGVAALCLSGMTAMAADDPIAVRKHIMASVGAAAGLSGGMMKGEVAYSPAAGKSAIATMAAVGFASLLVVIIQSDEVRAILTDLVRTALTVG